jgi:hypothetical protein
MLYGIDQPSCDIARAFFEVLYYTPTISSASHESGTYRRNADLEKSDAGIGTVVLRSRTLDDDGLAGFDRYPPAHNGLVVGSSPAGPTIFTNRQRP